MQILWAFRSNATEDSRFPIGMDCSGRLSRPRNPWRPTGFSSAGNSSTYTGVKYSRNKADNL
ncbi:MAG: hypothetical protein LBK44_06040 [Spirochaetales bacterium]|nr:hypothetical protein [Spirochaetales bacterium]